MNEFTDCAADVQIHKHPRLSPVTGAECQLVETKLDHIHLLAAYVSCRTVWDERECEYSVNFRDHLLTIIVGI